MHGVARLPHVGVVSLKRPPARSRNSGEACRASALPSTTRPPSRIARLHMLHAPSPSRRLAPERATRLLLPVIVLSLAALIAIPWWASTRHLQPLQHEMNQIADPVRGLMTRIHLSLAQEGNALDDFTDEREALSRGRFRAADSAKHAAYRQLMPLVGALGPAPKHRLTELLALDVR